MNPSIIVITTEKTLTSILKKELKKLKSSHLKNGAKLKNKSCKSLKSRLEKNLKGLQIREGRKLK
jgi:3-deoxy-D-manno-octulosonate 8-phosphate phosphatase KdsC-like HAD superfamily phosphatase